jgi:ribosomal protein L30/L7E
LNVAQEASGEKRPIIATTMTSTTNTSTSKAQAAQAQQQQQQPVDYSHLPLVPESVLKKRHDLDALKRKRDYAQEQAELAKKTKFQHSARNGLGRTAAGGKKEVFYVKKLETFMALAKQRKNNAIRYRRVSKKGMQKRASDQPEMAVREIPIVDNNNDTTTTTTVDEPVSKTTTTIKKQYQCNSVGMNLVFCLRIRDAVGAPDCVKKALSSLRLRKPWDGVFLRYNDTTRQTLHLVEPWVVYGKPTRAVVSDLVTRRGYARLEKPTTTSSSSSSSSTTTATATATVADTDKQGIGDKNKGKKQQKNQLRSFERVALSDNTVIEQALGDEHGILCVADLVEELYTVGPAFAAVNAFLWPFRLADSKTYFERQTLKLQTNSRDYYGDKGETINEYIQGML